VSSRRALASLVLAVAVAVPAGTMAGPAVADDLTQMPVSQPGGVAAGIRGGDISWPNCPTGMGVPGRRTQGLPLPTAQAHFFVIGLTNGRAFTRNPCLAGHLDAARDRGVPVSAYTMLSYPNAAERAAHGTSGPFGSATYADRIANVGYAQAAFALDTMAAAQFPSPFVWIDVEPRAERRWSRTIANNQALIGGALRAASDRGVGSGIYTYALAWRQITGGMILDVPLWAPGHSRARTFAGKMRQTIDSCSRIGFTGGPLVMAQWVWRNRDHDVTCPAIETVTTPLWVRLGESTA
jgi:hypothetical protein